MTSNYFSHDSNARNDEKLVRLRMRHKAAGYGVYFMILERMRDANNYMCAKDYNLIAFDLREDAALIKSVVEDFGLFVFTEDGKYFYSESFLKRMGMKDDVSRKRSEAGKKGSSKRWHKKGEEKQTDGKAIANLKQTDGKVIARKKESKESNISTDVDNNIPPDGGSSDGDTVRTQPKSFRSKVIEYFNDKMKDRSIKPIVSITDNTRRAEWLLARRREYGDDAIFRMIDKASGSAFLNGHNQKGFTASFDWLIRPNNFPKVLEGNYDDEKRKDYEDSRKSNSAEQRANDAASIVARLLAENKTASKQV
jgi:hypothetical protein